MSGTVLGDLTTLSTAKIKGDLTLSNGNFKHDVNLTGAEIGGALHLNSAEWSPDVTLRLRDAKVDRIPKLAAAWPTKMNVDGFTYRVVGAPDQFALWFQKADHFDPQPYEQLASIVQGQGNGSLATEIRRFGVDAECREAKGWRWVWLMLSGPLVGCGYYPAICILLGARTDNVWSCRHASFGGGVALCA